MAKKQDKGAFWRRCLMAWIGLLLSLESLYGAQWSRRDQYGIPHIYGDTDIEMGEEYGYQAAADRLGQLMMSRRAALGTMAEVFGPDLLQADILTRMDGYTTEELRQMFNRMGSENQALLQAYTDGVNRYLEEARTLECTVGAPIELTVLERLLQVPERDFTVEDMVAIVVFLVRRFGEIGGREVRNLRMLMQLTEWFGEATGLDIFNDLRFINDPNAPTTIPPSASASPRVYDSKMTLRQLRRLRALVDPEQISEKAEQREKLEREARSAWEAVGVPVKFGSYAWTISPDKSATANALEFGGPQTGFAVPALMHLVDLHSGEGLHVIGMGFVGAPAVLIGANESLAWTSTTGVGDNVDLYIEVLTEPVKDPLDPPPYLFKGQPVSFTRRVEEIKVHGGETVRVPVFRSVHGTTLVPFNVGDRTAITVYREHFFREPETLRGFLAFSRAKGLDDFETGIEEIVTSHNLLYVDKLGNTAYWMAGKVREKPAGADQRLPLIGDGTQEQPDAFIPSPRVINPPTGLLANWNNKPRVDYDNGDWVLLGKQFHVARIQELLNEFTADGRQMTLPEMNEINKDISGLSRTGVRKTFPLPYIEAAVKAKPTPERRAALAELSNWNGHTFMDPLADVNTLPGETIFDQWLQIMIEKTFGDELGAAGVSLSEAGYSSAFTDSDPNSLIHVLDEEAKLPGRLEQHYQGSYCNNINTGNQETCEELIIASLDQALTELEREFSSSDFRTWVRARGEFTFAHRFSPFAQSLGLPPIAFDPLPRGNRATYMHIINANQDLDGIYSIPLGQSGFIGLSCWPAGLKISPHASDLQTLFRNYEFISMLREEK